MRRGFGHSNCNHTSRKQPPIIKTPNPLGTTKEQHPDPGWIEYIIKFLQLLCSEKKSKSRGDDRQLPLAVRPASHDNVKRPRNESDHVCQKYGEVIVGDNNNKPFRLNKSRNSRQLRASPHSLSVAHSLLVHRPPTNILPNPDRSNL